MTVAVTVIENDDVLREIGDELKQAALIIADDDLENYAPTLEKAIESTKSPAVQKEIEASGGRKHILIDNHFVCLVFTKSDQGRMFHVSISCLPYKEGTAAGFHLHAQTETNQNKFLIFPETPATAIPKNLETKILDILFYEWESIPNPGKMHFVTHYLGE
jgi:hypothetical protein